MNLKIFIGLQLILLISSFKINQNAEDSLCSSYQLNAIYQAALQCQQGSQDDTIACIAISMQKATGSKWDVVSRDSYNTESAVAYNNFDHKCNITLKDWGQWKRTYWIWAATQNMYSMLTQQCKGINSTKRAIIQRNIDQCHNQSMQIEADCIRKATNNIFGGIWELSLRIILEDPILEFIVRKILTKIMILVHISDFMDHFKELIWYGVKIVSVILIYLCDHSNLKILRIINDLFQKIKVIQIEQGEKNQFYVNQLKVNKNLEIQQFQY